MRRTNALIKSGVLQTETAGLWITALAALTWLVLSAGPLDESLLQLGYTKFWSAHGTASPDFHEALRRDPASPYRWCDLAEALFQENDTASAQYCISRAVFLGPNVPAILLRAIHMNWLLGKPDNALTYSLRLLGLTAQYDSLVFHTYDRMGLTTEQVLSQGLPSDGRAARSYFRHLIITNRLDDLQTAWRWLIERAFVDEGTAEAYKAAARPPNPSTSH